MAQSHLQQRCVAEEKERQMQVDVHDGPVLVLPRWEKHLEGTQAERLREGKTQPVKITVRSITREVNLAKRKVMRFPDHVQLSRRR